MSRVSEINEKLQALQSNGLNKPNETHASMHWEHFVKELLRNYAYKEIAEEHVVKTLLKIGKDLPANKNEKPLFTTFHSSVLHIHRTIQMQSVTDTVDENLPAAQSLYAQWAYENVYRGENAADNIDPEQRSSGNTPSP